METRAANPLGYEKIGRLILRFSTPAIASNLLNAVYNIVDQIFIGHGIGTSGIAATNIAFPLVTLTGAISIMLGVGSASNFNLNLGAGKHEKASMIAGNGMSMMVLSGVALSALSLIFMNQLLVLFGANSEIMQLAKQYTIIIALGIPFQVITVGVCQVVRADGSPNWAMLSMMSGAAFNLIFDPVFMFVFGWGIRGIAVATALSQVLSAALALSYVLRGMKTVKLEKRSFALSLENAKAICALGAAGFANHIAMTLVNIVLNNTLKYYGDLSRYGSTVALGAVGAISKINVIFISCSVGLSQGCQPINGFNYGAKNFARVKKTLKSALICVTAMSVLFFGLFQLFPRTIIGIFGEGTQEYYEFATLYIRVFMFMTFANGLQPLVSGYFTATGRAKVGMFVSLTRQVIFLIPLLLILPVFYGIDGAVYAGPIADTIAACLAAFFIAREFKRLDTMITSSM